ncbi:alpha/beta hydrolase fold domain-containing protein [Amycolatopsis sp. ATCC 39116]|uniref:alpha/beta hydrolase fold domain-containing protein n=1 Tax=Amycolatopsis sp. (strain ATCC 39116 / 75iv2) TaxID=385957 RepID=UPI0002625579|nr:alpha/beta hydrolase fold domain-containing protein [Amycolatopsis sp. ATCC 39116]
MNGKLLATLAQFGLDSAAADPPVDRSGAPADIDAVIENSHAGTELLLDALPNTDPRRTLERVTRAVRTIRGADDNPIDLYIYEPEGRSGRLPAVLYFHGGGMTIVSADNRGTSTWCRELAALGLVVVGVGFRNAHHLGPNPFPAGLSDCVAAVRWLDEHRDDLGVSGIILQGESGGANLALAVALTANREGWSDKIAGVYALVPYISGAYGWPLERKLRELPSLVENDGYFVNCAEMDLFVHSYDPTGMHATDPLAWPYFATPQDVRGLPPHVISVDELDPLRDEGIAYFRKLQDAGVPVVGRVNLGITHAAESIFREASAEYFDATIADIHRFAGSL